MKKIDFKKYFLTKLKIAGFIFALVGWFLLFIFVFGQFFVEQLVGLEKILESNYFIWALRIIIISLVILLVKGQKFVQKITNNKKVKITLKIIFIGGALGWIWWFLTLIL
jgi:hypothetical protein